MEGMLHQSVTDGPTTIAESKVNLQLV